MSEKRFLLKQKGLELQAILDMNVFITQEQFEELEKNDAFEIGKIYFVLEE